MASQMTEDGYQFVVPKDLGGYKTLLFNVAMLLLAAVAYFNPEFNSPTKETVGLVLDQILLVVALLGNFGLRIVTNRPVLNRRVKSIEAPAPSEPATVEFSPDHITPEVFENYEDPIKSSALSSFVSDDDGVKIAGYAIQHPRVNTKPVDGQVNPGVFISDEPFPEEPGVYRSFGGSDELEPKNEVVPVQDEPKQEKEHFSVKDEIGETALNHVKKLDQIIVKVRQMRDIYQYLPNGDIIAMVNECLPLHLDPEQYNSFMEYKEAVERVMSKQPDDTMQKTLDELTLCVALHTPEVEETKELTTTTLG